MFGSKKLRLKAWTNEVQCVFGPSGLAARGAGCVLSGLLVLSTGRGGSQHWAYGLTSADLLPCER